MKTTWLAAAMTASALFFANPAQAAVEGPWCAILVFDDWVTEKCDMMTFEQCRAETMSMGGNHCSQNPRYHAAIKDADSKRRRVRPLR